MTKESEYAHFIVRPKLVLAIHLHTQLAGYIYEYMSFRRDIRKIRAYACWGLGAYDMHLYAQRFYFEFAYYSMT